MYHLMKARAHSESEKEPTNESNAICTYMHTCTQHTAASSAHVMKDARPELLEKAAGETRAHADTGIEHTRTHACASMPQLMEEEHV